MVGGQEIERSAAALWGVLLVTACGARSTLSSADSNDCATRSALCVETRDGGGVADPAKAPGLGSSLAGDPGAAGPSRADEPRRADGTAPEGSPPSVVTVGADVDVSAPSVLMPPSVEPGEPTPRPEVALEDNAVADAGAPEAVTEPSVVDGGGVAQKAPDPATDAALEQPGPWGGTLPETPSETLDRFEGCAVLEWLDADVTVSALSGDGTTLVGHAGPPPGMRESRRNFRWRRGEPLEWLEDGVVVNDLSHDGNWLAAERTSSAALVDASGQLSELLTRGRAEAISADGQIVFGSGNDLTREDGSLGHGTFRWSEAIGVQALPPRGYYQESPLSWSVRGASADGSIVLGSASGPAPASPVSLWWNEATGIVFLDATSVSAISDDGTVVVGAVGGLRGPSAAGAWQLPGGEPLSLGFPEPLAQLPGSVATRVNADGSVILGYGRIEDAEPTDEIVSQAYVFREGAGTQPLHELLQAACIDPNDVQHTQWRVAGISSESRILAGYTVGSTVGRSWVVGWE